MTVIEILGGKSTIVSQEVNTVVETFKRASQAYPNGWLLKFNEAGGEEVLINYKMIVKVEKITKN